MWTDSYDVYCTNFGTYETHIIKNFEVENECKDAQETMEKGDKKLINILHEQFVGGDRTSGSSSGDLESLQVSVINAGLVNSMQGTGTEQLTKASDGENFTGAVADVINALEWATMFQHKDDPSHEILEQTNCSLAKQKDTYVNDKRVLKTYAESEKKTSTGIQLSRGM